MPYQPPVRDHVFLLRDVLEIEKYANLPGFAAASMDVIEQIIEEAGRFTGEVLAPLNSVGDKEGCTWNSDHTVKTPTGFKDAYAKLVEGGWPALGAEPEHRERHAADAGEAVAQARRRADAERRPRTR